MILLLVSYCVEILLYAFAKQAVKILNYPPVYIYYIYYILYILYIIYIIYYIYYIYVDINSLEPELVTEILV